MLYQSFERISSFTSANKITVIRFSIKFIESRVVTDIRVVRLNCRMRHDIEVFRVYVHWQLKIFMLKSHSAMYRK